MIEDSDPVIARIADALRPLPAVDDSAKARVLVAVAAERERDREAAVRRRRWGAPRWLVASVGVAAAALVAVVVLRPSAPASVASSAPVSVTTPARAPAQLAAHDANSDPADAPRDVQLVLRAPTAGRVRVVGDFNSWDAQRAPMVRDAASGLWSVTLSLKPGRHVYAFVVDDTLWMRDPRAPAAPDADFGRPGSVLLVGRP